ncbi:MAG: caspase family protein, partial [Acidobacteria bacterium]|nr:caspase family protein [Acidobacteriota bacterium]
MKTEAQLLRFVLIMSAAACALALPPPRSSSARQEDGRGLTSVRIRVEDGKELKLYEKSFALVIGVSDYTQGWPKLPGVKRDVEEVARALERHGFLVTKVENPDSTQLDKVFKTFIDTYGLGVENRLLFYFAGHGHTVRQSYGEEMGYIVPADAPLPERDRAGFMSKAMDMQQME